MNKKWDKNLCEDFSMLFRFRNLLPSESCMSWGFPGDGWYEIIRDAAEKLTELNKEYRRGKKLPVTAMSSSQIKNKFGLLRWYLDFPKDFPEELRSKAYSIIGEAEKKSEVTCESCGKNKSPGPGMRSRCDECWGAGVWKDRSEAQPEDVHTDKGRGS